MAECKTGEQLEKYIVKIDVSPETNASLSSLVFIFGKEIVMERSIEFLTVGKLKGVLEDIPDDVYVAIVDPFGKNHINLVTSMGYLKCEYEKCDVVGLLYSDNASIKASIKFEIHPEKDSIDILIKHNDTDYCSKELFNSREVNK